MLTNALTRRVMEVAKGRRNMSMNDILYPKNRIKEFRENPNYRYREQEAVGEQFLFTESSIINRL